MQKVAVVTGANGGIGKEAAVALAQAGMRVLAVCRDRARGEAAAEEISRRAGSSAVELCIADLSSQRSIRSLAAELHSKCETLQLLVNNAGVVLPDRRLTADGLEYTFALNHLGYFLLTNLLLDLLKAGAPSRIVSVASGIERIGRLAFEDLQAERRYVSWLAYAMSKRANVAFTYALARRLAGTGVTANVVHPGPVATGFGSEYRGLTGLALKLSRPFLRTPEKGAETVLWVALDPALERVSGKYFCDKKEIRSARETYVEAVQERLWEESQRLTAP